jgi:hypothetical protein
MALTRLFFPMAFAEMFPICAAISPVSVLLLLNS